MLIQFLRRVLGLWLQLLSGIRLLVPRMLGLRPGRNLRVGAGIQWPLGNLRNVHLGENVSLGKCGWFYIPLSNRTAAIHVGDGTAIGDQFTISCNESIRIGKNCLVSYRVSILDHNHVTGLGVNPVTSGITPGKPIEVGDNCFVGTGVVILRGVKIGKNCVVNANSVVMQSFEDNCIVSGSPATVVKILSQVTK